MTQLPGGDWVEVAEGVAVGGTAVFVGVAVAGGSVGVAVGGNGFSTTGKKAGMVGVNPPAINGRDGRPKVARASKKTNRNPAVMGIKTRLFMYFSLLVGNFKLTAVKLAFIMLAMLEQAEIDPNKMYTTAEVAGFTKLSAMHITRLADAGEFPGSERKAPVPRSPRMIPGSAVISFLEKRKLNQQD